MTGEFVDYYLDGEDLRVPALNRPGFKGLINQIKKRRPRPGIRVLSPLALSPTEEGFYAVIKRLRQNLIDVRFLSDPSHEEMKRVESDERIKRMLGEVRKDGTEVEFLLASHCPSYRQKVIPSAIALDKSLSIYLAGKSHILNDAAHELMHRLLEHEGYPTGRPAVEDKELDARREKFGYFYSSAYSAIVDIEVDKRLVEYGFDPREATDGDARGQIERMRKNPVPEHREELEVLKAALHGPYRHYWLSGELKAEYFDLLKRDAPVYDLAMEIIGIVEKNGGTGKPENVRRILDQMEGILERFGIEPPPFRSYV